MKIVVLDGETLNPGDVAWEALARLGELTVYPDTDPADFAERVMDADVVLVNKVKIMAPDLAMLSACKLIGVLATGTNNLDLQAIREAGVSVCNVPGYGVADVAQQRSRCFWKSATMSARKPKACARANGKGAASGVTGRKRRFAFPG